MFNPGETLLHYRIIDKLGEGGMGVVWRASDEKLGREVAIKVLPEELARNPERRRRFEREASAIAALKHPNIVTIYALEEDAGVHFISMELVSGDALADLIPAGGFPLPSFLEFADQIVDAVSDAHAKGITHRDIKPSNIMLDEDGRVKVLDFGLAKLAEEISEDDATVSIGDRTAIGQVLGTIAYMSPEQAEGGAVDHRSDIFSLGILLYEMATGRHPFKRDRNVSTLSAILTAEPTPAVEINDSLPPELGEIISRCLKKDREQRYASAPELRDRLTALRDEVVSGVPSGILPKPAGSSARRGGLHRRLALGALAVVVIGGLAWWGLHRSAQQRWVHDQAIPELEAIVDTIQGLEEGPESWQAYTLARRIEEIAPDEPLVERLWPRFSREISITSDPPGAVVHAKYYGNPDSDWVPIGRTPLENVRYPKGFTRLQLELPGRLTMLDVVWNLGYFDVGWHYVLHQPGAIPDEMVWVPGGEFPLMIPGLDHLEPEPTRSFLNDRTEVTNREYKRFVEAGGYDNRDFWTHPFLDGDRELSWEEARLRFVDRTGQTGPANWEIGDYPTGRGDMPVSGVSWYEAAAFAVWADKSLPTVFHWNRVAFTVGASQIVPLSNFSGSGTVAAGSTNALNRFGAYDLGGNIREWVYNESGRSGQRFILGGGWDDPGYAFTDAYAQDAFDRSPTNGFRCIRYLEPEDNLDDLARTIDTPFRDFLNEDPVSDEVFSLYLRQFAYDRTPLEAVVEEDKKMPSGLRRQKITFEAAYDGERMAAYLFLPEGGTPPYQTVVMFPGSGSIHTRSSADLDLQRSDFLVKGGRAVLFPILKGTYERGGDLKTDYPSETTSHKDYVIRWVKDLGRSIDYIETRDDLDSDRIGYFGLSWGGAMGAIMPAAEPRFKAVVLYVAGLMFQRALPEVDQIHYLPRVTQPTLMLNGELDFFFPVETSQKPMFELLGTPPEHKQYRVYPGGHSAPRVEVIKESLNWFDRYLGPTS